MLLSKNYQNSLLSLKIQKQIILFKKELSSIPNKSLNMFHLLHKANANDSLDSENAFGFLEAFLAATADSIIKGTIRGFHSFTTLCSMSTLLKWKSSFLDLFPLEKGIILNLNFITLFYSRKTIFQA